MSVHLYISPTASGKTTYVLNPVREIASRLQSIPRHCPNAHSGALVAATSWDWRRQRNPARAELETRYGYDTKHAMHLFRLLRMGEEILCEGVVRVLRPDAEWLLGVRDGALSYDEVIHLAGEHEAKLAALVEQSRLPLEPDLATADALLIELQREFLFG